MDEINVSDQALRRSAAAIRQLGEQALKLSGDCYRQISAQLSGLESNFRADVLQFIQEIQSFNKKIATVVSENVSAISDRLKNLAEYEKQTYKRVNIG